MKNLLQLFAILLALLCGVWTWCWRSGDATIPDIAPCATTVGRQGQGLGGSALRHETERPVSEVAVLRGRCVDEAGRPLAGARVTIRGFRSRGVEATHKWQMRRLQTTKATGRFEFRVGAAELYGLDIDLYATGRVGLTASWYQVEVGFKRDLGDCILVQSRCVVRGRVADTDGVPRAGVVVQLLRKDRQWRQAPSRRLRPYEFGPFARSGNDGSFELREPVGPGKWDCHVSGARAQLVDSKTLVVGSMDSEQFLELVIKSEADIPSIRGIVVDELDGPVPNASVQVVRAGAVKFDRLWSSSTRGGETGRDGKFVIDSKEHKPAGRVMVGVLKEGYEWVKSSELSWGAKDVRLVLRRGVAVTFLVTDAETKEPVERLSLALNTSSVLDDPAGTDTWQIEPGYHAGGRVETRPLRRGQYWCEVQPTHKKWLKCLCRFKVTDRPGPTVQIALQRAAVRTLRVESIAGKPIQGTSVELLEDSCEQPVGLDMLSGKVKWCEGVTGQGGEFELRGPVRTPLAARILGPGHPPTVLNGILLESGSKAIVVKIAEGGTIHGRIGPEEFLQQMRQMGKHLIWPEPPGLRLERGPIHEPTERFPAIFFEAFPIGKDGSFEIGGIRAGSWRLSLHWGEWRFASTHSFPLGLVTNLRDGERRKLDFDLRDHLFAHVRGKVLLNGKAYQGKVTFTASDASQVEATSNEDGSFETYLRAGSYRVHVHEWPGGWDSRVAANSRLTVAAGQEVEHTVRVTGVRLRLRILDPRGSSCGGVDILTLMEGDTDTQFVGRSDEDGLVISRFLTPGLYQLRAWPKRLAKEDARARFRKEHSGDLGAMERVLVPLTTIVVDVGLGGLIEVRLPKAAGY